VIVTDRFVFLAFPRTGTTFVRDVLKQLYLRTETGLAARLGLRRTPSSSRLRELILPMTDTLMAEREGRSSQHGGVRQIPAEARHLPIVSVARHPLDQVVSAYEHRFWREHPVWDVETLRAAYPGYPELTFEQYLAMMQTYGVRNLLKGKPLEAHVGFLTLRFLKFYGLDPERLIDSLTDDGIDRGLFRTGLASVHFVHTENLVPELRDFLATVGFPPDATAFMATLPRVNAAAPRQGKPWSAYFTPALAERTLHDERALFRLFPEYGNHGTFPYWPSP
jgi:hypothetical protein